MKQSKTVLDLHLFFDLVVLFLETYPVDISGQMRPFISIQVAVTILFVIENNLKNKQTKIS